MEFLLRRASMDKTSWDFWKNENIKINGAYTLQSKPIGGRERIYFAININTLEDLVEFSKKYGEIIIEPDDIENRHCITIYDYYLE